MTNNFFHVSIEFKSIKDLGQVYRLELKGLEQIISTITEDSDLREAELYLKDLLSIVENRQAANVAARYNGKQI